jgi:predicted nucleic acid-binding protein
VKPVLVDASFLIAAYSKRDPYHILCLKAYQAIENPLVTCEPVIAEALHLLRLTCGAAEDILSSVEKRILEIPFRLEEFAAPVRRILQKYQDLPADLADACLIHMADQLDTGDILTLDSDFKHYRWRRTRAFNLLIPLEYPLE